ncbi:MAG: Eco57I restriction-modification methylase domain-containing protein, partial [bacterium]
MTEERFAWWNNVRHGGLLLDAQRLNNLIPEDPSPLDGYTEDRLRRRITTFQEDPTAEQGKFVRFVLEVVCGLSRPAGEWSRGPEVSKEWSQRMMTGESVRPRHLWIGKNNATLPVFMDDQPRLGVGRGKRILGHVLQWLRKSGKHLAIVTNGQQWRLVFAGLDYEAFCQWDIETWFAEGAPSAELTGFRSLIDPALWTPPEKDQSCPLLAAINESRKGQADLSQVLGERVRKAVEILLQGHQAALTPLKGQADPQDIYRAAVRIVMRMVVILFAESREGLLPRDNPLYHAGYSLHGLREQLQRTPNYRLKSGLSAWPRVLSLFRLIYHGCSHEALLVPAYGGELFARGNGEENDGMIRALAVFENACFEHEIMTDDRVQEILELLTRTKIRIRQGRASTWVPAPVDFSSLDSEYIGILYEGLLDFELRTAPDDEPVVFLCVGNQPALPLATLEAMDDKSLKDLLEKLKDTSSDDGEEEANEAEALDAETEELSGEEQDEGDDEKAVEPTEDTDQEEDHADAATDIRHTMRARAETWARRACEVGKLVRKPRGKITPEKKLRYEADLDRKARQITSRVVLPGEWYLVRWGGTRKGAGTFYTRPQLAVPTVHRTLRPLAYDPPLGKDGQPNEKAPVESWTPKPPEDILALKVCDPACGSGSFPLAALRFLTEALYAALHHHGRIRDHGGRAVLDLIKREDNGDTLASEALPCRPDDDEFEVRTKAVLRRYIVERCIYGVDLDPLAVELCRLSLWIETLDPRLPFTFLDHKVKCGNSLVGAWFDQFQHYPAMAWEREGGDKNHTNGVHFKKEEWTKAIKERKKNVKGELIEFIDGRALISSINLSTARTSHDVVEAALQRIHTLGIHQAAERSEQYQQLRRTEEYQRLKQAFDLWCALWFWPPTELDDAPMPLDYAAGELSEKAHDIVCQLTARHRFFHWELEFPDVFNASSHGFDAILGNPPWENLQPNPEEFFSAFDPLFRAYGQVAKGERRKRLFKDDQGLEQRWLLHCDGFKGIANWVAHVAFPFGDKQFDKNHGKQSYQLNLGDRGRRSSETCRRRHHDWRRKREEATGYADIFHPFRYQTGRIFTYKLFLESGHSLLKQQGRLGFIVPSG